MLVTYNSAGEEIKISKKTFKKTHGHGGQEVASAYHTGGVIYGQINKLHIGVASQFANPMSHEVDIRTA